MFYVSASYNCIPSFIIVCFTCRTCRPGLWYMYACVWFRGGYECIYALSKYTLTIYTLMLTSVLNILRVLYNYVRSMYWVRNCKTFDWRHSQRKSQMLKHPPSSLSALVEVFGISYGPIPCQTQRRDPVQNRPVDQGDPNRPRADSPVRSIQVLDGWTNRLCPIQWNQVNL